MLQKLNERIQGLVAWIIIVLVTITFALFGIDYYMQSRHESVALVEINGQPITKQAFDLSYRRTRQLRDLPQMTQAHENQLKRQLLDEMIVNSVSTQAARQAGFEVTSLQANTAIVGIPQFQADGHFSSDRYAQVLNSAFFTPESFQQEVRQGMLLNQQRFALIGTSFALPNELQQFVKLYMQTRDYDYLRIPALRFLSQTRVSDAEIQQYYQQNKKIFLNPEKVSVDYIRLSAQAIKDQLTVSPEQIQRYYQENQSNYFAPAQWQVLPMLFAVPEHPTAVNWANSKQLAQKTYGELQANPAEFETKLKSLAKDKAIFVQRENLTWVTAGRSNVDKVLMNLTTVGQISSPIKTERGYEIFKIVEYKPAAVKPLQAVEAEIKEQLLTERMQAKYAQALEQLTDLSYQTPDSLRPVAKALNLNITQTELFSRHGGVTPLTQNKQVLHAAFSQDVLKFGNNSEPIQLDNDSVIVLRVNKHVAPKEKALIDVKSLIAEKLAHKKAEAEARQFGLNLLSAKSNPEQQSKLLEGAQLQWHDVAEANRDVDIHGVPPAIHELAFKLPMVGEASGLSLVDGDYMIVRLKKIHEGNVNNLDKEQVSSITQQIEANYGLMDYDLYINNLMQQAKVVKH